MFQQQTRGETSSLQEAFFNVRDKLVSFVRKHFYSHHQEEAMILMKLLLLVFFDWQHKAVPIWVYVEDSCF